MKKAMRFAIAGALAVVLYVSSPASGCGPFFPTTIFTTSHRPDEPLKLYAGGRLGVLMPTYSRSYLVVAYRYLGGTPLKTEEQIAAVKLWELRLTPEYYFRENEAPISAAWAAERAKLVTDGKPPAIDELAKKYDLSPNEPTYYLQYHNCLADAFATAAATARDRAAKWGAGNMELANWVSGQDAVFANCGGFPSGSTRTATSIHLPDRAPDGTSALLQADRQYQIAAAEFYGGHFEDAEAKFHTIAHETDSPWRKIAAVMAPRCEIRLATLASEGDEKSVQHLRTADVDLKAILADASLADVHPAAQRLEDYVAFRLRPAEQLNELAVRLAAPDSAGSFGQNLDDYTHLMDEAFGGDDSGVTRLTKEVAQELTKPDIVRDDLTDWVRTYQTGSPEAYEHALKEMATDPQHPVAAFGAEQDVRNKTRNAGAAG